MSERFHIRALDTLKDFERAEEVQRLVWKIEGSGIVPLSIMLPIRKNGGVVLGAFERERMVGVCLGFLARTPEGGLMLWSHMNGVLDEMRGLGLGERLKWAQRAAAMSMGLDLIRWTVDPLEGRNASLNFGKLGVTCHTYEQKVYGTLQDGLNAGIDSDRFVVDWKLTSPRVNARTSEGKCRLTLKDCEDLGAQWATFTDLYQETIRRISDFRLDLSGSDILVEIPAEYQEVKARDLNLAVDWRMKTRQIFEAYFRKGYEAIEFISQVSDTERRSFFLLERI